MEMATSVHRKRAPLQSPCDPADDAANLTESESTTAIFDADTPLDNTVDNDDDMRGAPRRWTATQAVSVSQRPITPGRCSALSMVRFALAVSALSLLLMRWKWVYDAVVTPLENRLGKDVKTEAEPLVLLVGLVTPFVIAGTVFYMSYPNGILPTAQPTLCTHGHGDTAVARLVAGFRAWRRRRVNSSLDTVDVLVILVFTLVQLNALAGKFHIDYTKGKVAKDGYVNRTARALGMNGFYTVVGQCFGIFDATSLTFLCEVQILSILLVSRKSFVHQALRLSGERAARYHVWCGNLGAVLLSLHGILYVFCWTRDGKLWATLMPCLDCPTGSKQFYKTARNFFGLLALLVLLVVAAGSLERVRRARFRQFSLVHCLNGVFVTLTCLHYYPAVFWLLPVILVYVVYRAISVFSRGSCQVLSARSFEDNIVQLELGYCGGISGASSFLPGQYVYIKIREISNMEWHPFSISSSPRRSQASLTVDIKVHGPFTSALLDLVKRNSLTTVQVDGFYGSMINIHSPELVFVAGGSGMTPFLSALEHLWLLSQNSETAVNLPQRLWIVWTARDIGLLQAHAQLLERIRHSSAWKCRLLIHWTGRSSDQADKLIAEQPTAASSEPRPSSTSSVGHNGAPLHLVFVSAVVGIALMMALVVSSDQLGGAWWSRRVSLLWSASLGGIGGASWMLYRSWRQAPGFERVPSEETEKVSALDAMETQTPCDILEAFSVGRNRPNLASVLRSIHSDVANTISDEDGHRTVRVLVSGPNALQETVCEASSTLASPFFSVERHSFTV
ncbi:hypothetical protein PINS_up003845 [Pythium insidiosum]|nr:hypothetical protein PINS_up003845 [Pythium insidiosum]